jgi:hypothetical protein
MSGASRNAVRSPELAVTPPREHDFALVIARAIALPCT